MDQASTADKKLKEIGGGGDPYQAKNAVMALINVAEQASDVLAKDGNSRASKLMLGYGKFLKGWMKDSDKKVLGAMVVSGNIVSLMMKTLM